MRGRLFRHGSGARSYPGRPLTPELMAAGIPKRQSMRPRHLLSRQGDSQMFSSQFRGLPHPLAARRLSSGSSYD